MALLEPVSEKKAKGKVKKIYEDIKKTRKISKIPNFWKTIANDPNTLERTWNSLKQVMVKGSLDSLTKELIYIAVSMTNSCEYCIRSHTAAAKKRGMTNNMLNELIAVVGMANETNRLVESYQVEVDKIYKSYEDHPVKKLYDQGLKITVNSDDPPFFNASIDGEYKVMSQLGLSDEELLSLTKNAIHYSFCEKETKNQLLNKLK